MPDGTRYTQLDGVRGYAAIAVIVFHSILDLDPTQNERIVRPPIQDAHGIYDVVSKLVLMVLSGETAVILFFVLSGVVLFESLRRRHAGALATAAGFSIRRFFRIYPTFFVCLAACLAAFAGTGGFFDEASRFWPNAALYDFSILGASWTLQVEFLAVPFILAGFWSFRRFGVLGIVAAYAIFAAILLEPWMRAHLVNYQRFLSCFALGMLIPSKAGATVARCLPVAAAPIVLIAMFAARHLMSLHWWSMDAAQVLAALFITMLYYGRAGGLGRFLGAGVSQYLGRLSYSLYLFNVVYLIIFDHWTSRISLFRSHPLEWGLLMSIPIVAATIVTAHFAEIGLERPSIALGRRLTRFSLGTELPAAGTPSHP